MSEITVEDYSDKSVVVRGKKTKEIKDSLKQLGGKWNSSLKNGGGWIFPKTKESQVKSLVNSDNITFDKGSFDKGSFDKPKICKSDILQDIQLYLNKCSKQEKIIFMNNVFTIALTINDVSNKDVSEEESSEDEEDDIRPRKRLL
jgi:hypothetical protein